MTANRVFGICFVLLAGFIYAVAREIRTPELLGDPGPTLLPNIVAVLMGVLGALLFIGKDDAPAASTPGDHGPPTRGGLAILFASGAAVIGYVALFKLVGFTIATWLYLFAGITILGTRSPRAMTAYALAAGAASLVLGFVLTTLLELPLPGVLL